MREDAHKGVARRGFTAQLLERVRGFRCVCPGLSSDQFTGLNGIVVPGTLRDSMYLLEVVLGQQTSLRPMEIMTDTAGVSDIVFALFWLLGYQFSPRLADIGEARYWRLDAEADYGPLNGIARQTINTKLIEDNWEDILRIMASLKLGTIKPSELMRSLLRSKNPSTVARALRELGRIPKTTFMLNFVDDPNYRRRILTRLNHGESRWSLARAICHGKRGEIRKRYREGQEDQLGALGLVLNIVILWQTLYMNEAVNVLRDEGEIDDEDISRLSPVVHGNINMLGRYSFHLAESVRRGELRSLRTP